MTSNSLNGQWAATQVGKSDPVPATVPGCIHTALLAAGKIEDPFYRDQEFSSFWVGDADWLFRRSFDVPASLLARDGVRLRCLGLDTLATIRINGQTLGHTDNMHRTWEFDVKALLRVGENTIDVRFDSAVKSTEVQDRQRHLPKWGTGDQRGAHNHIRKEACKAAALWSWIELKSADCRASDNFVHLRPEDTVRLTVTPSTPLSLKQFKSELMLKSLVDLSRAR